MLRIVLILLLSLTLVSCSETPTGRNQFTLVPEAVMDRIGARTFAQMTQAGAVVADTAATAPVQCVAQAVVAAARRLYPDVDMPARWQVEVFRDSSPNAFALPGGHIGVHTGMLRVTENADQLAAVIGHEVAHVLADHGNERLTQKLGISAVLFLVGVFTEGEIPNDLLLDALGVGARVGVALPFSRAHEREADLMGQRIMAAAGFEPAASVALWRNMAARGGDAPPEFLSTHPANESRIETLGSHLDEARALYEKAGPTTCRTRD